MAESRPASAVAVLAAHCSVCLNAVWATLVQQGTPQLSHDTSPQCLHGSEHTVSQAPAAKDYMSGGIVADAVVPAAAPAMWGALPLTSAVVANDSVASAASDSTCAAPGRAPQGVVPDAEVGAAGAASVALAAAPLAAPVPPNETERTRPCESAASDVVHDGVLQKWLEQLDAEQQLQLNAQQ